MGWGWIIGVIVLVVEIWVFIRAMNQTGGRKPPEEKSPWISSRTGMHGEKSAGRNLKRRSGISGSKFYSPDPYLPGKENAAFKLIVDRIRTRNNNYSYHGQ